MRTICTLVIVLCATAASAQTTTTTTVSFGGPVNCQLITLLVTRTQAVDTQTTLAFAVKECENGSTIPTKYVAYFNSPIPTPDFSADKTSAHLLTSSPYGPMKVDWAVTTVSHSSYDAVWNWFTPNRIRETQSDDTQSARATGTIGPYTIDRTGYLTVSTVRK